MPEPPRWRELARKGEYARAWALVAAAGFDAVAARADGDSLLLLADVARFTRHVPEAAHALSALRARLPNHARAADAAFLLGRLAFDQERAPAQAARWFAIYLAERPTGAFAREAAGRAIECHQQLGELSVARHAAERYLAAHPDGPHRVLARALLEGVEAHE